jgi:hypothetical protein
VSRRSRACPTLTPSRGEDWDVYGVCASILVLLSARAVVYSTNGCVWSMCQHTSTNPDKDGRL